MGKYKVLKNVESAKGGKFLKDEVVEGTPSIKTPTFIEVLRTNTWGDGKNILFLDFDVEKVDDSTPLTPIKTTTTTTTTTPTMTQDEIGKNLYVFATIGLAVGLGFAYYRKSGFGGYVGYAILGSIVGQIGYNLMKKK